MKILEILNESNNNMEESLGEAEYSDKERTPLFTDEESKQREIAYLKKRLAAFDRMDNPDASDVRIAMDHKKRLDKLTK